MRKVSSVVLRSLSMIGLMFTLFSKGSLAIPACSGGHCGKVHAEMNQVCISMGFSGKPFPVVGPDGSVCTCPCSCIAAGTEVATPTGEVKIENMKEGDEVTQVYGETSSTRVTKILRTTLAVPHSVSELQYQGRKITVSSNHPFVTPDYQVVTAKTLKEGSMVLDGGGKAVQIEANTIREDFIGDLYNLIIHPESDRPIDHVVITNGIQSGDFLTQATLDSIQMDLDLREGKLIPIK